MSITLLVCEMNAIVPNGRVLFLFCFFHDPADVGNLISSSSDFSKPSLNIWKFKVHVLLKPNLENFEHYFASVCDECNCATVECARNFSRE